MRANIEQGDVNYWILSFWAPAWFRNYLGFWFAGLITRRVHNLYSALYIPADKLTAYHQILFLFFILRLIIYLMCL